MTYRENILAILQYQPYEKMPLVSFGYWNETLEKWAKEGHIPLEDAFEYAEFGDNSPADQRVMKKLGFDFNWNSCFHSEVGLFPRFKEEILELFSDGSRNLINEYGLIVKDKPGTVSIPAEIGTSLTDRTAWETKYLPKMQYSPDRISWKSLKQLPPENLRQIPLGLHCGSLIGTMRNYLGVEQLSYLYVDDEDLFIEIINQFAFLSFTTIKEILKTGITFDYAHFWEDICFKNGPLISPKVFERHIGPHYQRITNLLKQYDIHIVSVDCDGQIDSLIPTWLQNGVNTMFPIEVGTWNASIEPWRKQYGQKIRGVGGMNKTVFAKDYKAIDAEIERLKPLIDLGGYIPCPDHRIAPDAKFSNVQYYCQQLQKVLDT